MDGNEPESTNLVSSDPLNGQEDIPFTQNIYSVRRGYFTA